MEARCSLQRKKHPHKEERRMHSNGTWGGKVWARKLQDNLWMKEDGKDQSSDKVEQTPFIFRFCAFRRHLPPPANPPPLKPTPDSDNKTTHKNTFVQFKETRGNAVNSPREPTKPLNLKLGTKDYRGLKVSTRMKSFYLITCLWQLLSEVRCSQLDPAWLL